MGQKVSPIGLRVGVIRDWDARWFFDQKDVPAILKEDLEIRKFISAKFKNKAVGQVVIERKSKDKVDIYIHTGLPGALIGQDGAIKMQTVKEIQKITNGKSVMLNIKEIRKPELDATIVAEKMARELEERASFRKVQKMAIQRALKGGAKGCKTMVSGRLGGAEMARSEGYSEGRVPLHTLRADVDYAHAEANTTYGILGVKVWIYKGEVLPKKKGDR